MLSTMQDFPLNIGMIYRHGRTVHRNSQVVTFHPDGSRRASFAEVADRAELLAAALHRLGIVPGDRVGTFIWNVQEHIEAYFAIPCMGAVCHTLNLRLFPEQLTYIVNHAADRAIIVGADLVPLLAAVAGDLKTVEYYIVVGDGDVSPLVEAAPAAQVFDYEELLAAETLGFDWPDVDEREAAAMCYTSGTTGHPKGVVYSHRSTVLHSITAHGPSGLLFTPRDVVLPIVPMFHANAWGIPYAIWMVGADLVLPGKYLQGEFVARMVEEEQATWSGGVPTIWTDVLQYAATHDVDLSSLRGVLSGGSAVPRVLIERMWNELGVAVLQGWGMTETSPLAAIGWPPRGTETGSEEDVDWRVLSGRIVPGVELRLVDDDGTVVPWDGESIGEIEARGPWVTASYYEDPAPDRFHDGWLCTGDIASISPDGFIKISDRSKDVIKSGGEWISSVELEGLLMAHPEVLEAAVIAVPDPKWDERPLACVVRISDSEVSAAELCGFLSERIARWQLPERWAFIEVVPKTSVGKFDKKVLRTRHADGELVVEELR
jgi:fatty-acyl-CoA synthase